MEEFAKEEEEFAKTFGLMNLYVVYLGGKMIEKRMGEDHEVVVVVAYDIKAARKAAKAKWTGVGDPHVDAVQLLDVVDGYKVVLHSTGAPTKVILDDTYIP